MNRCIALVTVLAGVGISASSVYATEITFGGKTYESVDWTSASSVTDTAAGTISGVSVTLILGCHVSAQIDRGVRR